eukprot:1147316-Pelagomonas_calceolata.AAC.6
MAKPAPPHTEVALRCRAWGNNKTFLQQTMPCSRRQAGMVSRWTAKSPERTPPGPGPSKGIHTCMLMELVSTGAVPGA